MGKIKKIGGNQNSSPASIDLNGASDLECSNCGCKLFTAAFMFKKISALVAPSGKESLVPIQTFRCSECGNIEKDFLPIDDND